MIGVEQIEPDFIDRAWPHMAEHLGRAIRRMKGPLTLETIREKALRSEYGLWAIYDRDHPLPFLASAVTYIVGDVVTIAVLGGTQMKKWLGTAIAQFEDMARSHNMAEVEIEGRIGWARALPGYSAKRIVIRKEL